MDTGVLDWLYENSLRAYPLVDSIGRNAEGYTLDNDIILDAQFVYNSLSSPIQLLSLLVDSTNATFACTGGVNFVVPKAIAEVTYTRLSQGHLLVVSPQIAQIPEGLYTFSNLFFEPSVAHEFGGAWHGVPSIVFGAGDPVVGELNFVEGYQFNIVISGQTINLAVGSLYGKQVSCTHFSDYPDNCSSLLSYISGATPDGNGSVFIRAGTGIVVLDDPDNHRIYIGFTFTSGKDICPNIPPFPLV